MQNFLWKLRTVLLASGLSLVIILNPLLRVPVIYAADPIPFTPAVSDLEIDGMNTKGRDRATDHGDKTYYDGQYFDGSNTLALPMIQQPELLENPHGYSLLLSEMDLYLVWCTRDDGRKEYYVLAQDNIVFEALITEIDEYDQYMRSDPPLEYAMKGFGGIARALGGVSVAGACFVATGVAINSGVFAPLAIPLVACAGAAFYQAVDGTIDFLTAEERRRNAVDQMDDLESGVQGWFRKLEFWREEDEDEDE